MNKPTISVLLVEDNEDDAVLIQYALDGVATLSLCDTVQDGIEALRFLRKEGPYENSACPDLILLDINLPRMDGFEVLREVKADARLAAVPVIMLTTSKNESDVKRAYSYGASSFVTKPFDLSEMKTAAAGIGTYWTKIARVPACEKRT